MIRKLVLMALLSPLLLLVPAVPAAAAPTHSAVVADSVGDACTAIELSGTNCNGPKNGNRISGVIKAILEILSAIVGIAAVIMIIIGGFKYITSGGDTNSVAGAKNTIIYAIVGLIVVAVAQVIVRFVISSVG